MFCPPPFVPRRVSVPVLVHDGLPTLRRGSIDDHKFRSGAAVPSTALSFQEDLAMQQYHALSAAAAAAAAAQAAQAGLHHHLGSGGMNPAAAAVSYAAAAAAAVAAAANSTASSSSTPTSTSSSSAATSAMLRAAGLGSGQRFLSSLTSWPNYLCNAAVAAKAASPASSSPSSGEGKTLPGLAASGEDAENATSLSSKRNMNSVTESIDER